MESCESTDIKGYGMCKRHYYRWKKHGETFPHVEWASGQRDYLSIDERFDARIDKSGDCWVWVGNTEEFGYGTMRVGGRKRIYAHRYAYERAFGPIPPALFVCHSCDNPPCVRPSHLFLGTNSDNIKDMWRKGRAAPQRRAALRATTL